MVLLGVVKWRVMFICFELQHKNINCNYRGWVKEQTKHDIVANVACSYPPT